MKLTFAKDVYQFGKTSMDFRKETVVMGILNVTPDSFSDGGKYARIETALQHAREMIKGGAKIIDVGGESTRPGYAPVSVDEEIERIVPVIEALAKDLGCVVSIDTHKSGVAEAAIKAGAHIINDVWGAKWDPEIVYIAAKYDVPIILMHNREKPVYKGSFMNEVLKDLKESIGIAQKAGVSTNNIWLDPGVGFAKNTKQNIQVMQGLDEISELGYPVLLGTSRKSVIGNVLGLPVSERLEGTGATVCYGIEHGSHIMRVHDVKEIVRISKMMDVLTGKSTYEE